MTTITGSFCCRVETTKKASGAAGAETSRSSGKTASRSRKLLTAEEPEVLRPHCEKCGIGEALRPGLDCRCHCPQCSAAKRRCSSPRMALRRQERETCETFQSKLAMTRSRTAARSAASTKTAHRVEQQHTGVCETDKEDKAQRGAGSAKRQPSGKYSRISNTTRSTEQPRKCKTFQEAEPGLGAQKPEAGLPTVVIKREPSGPVCQQQSLSTNATKEKNKQPPAEEHNEDNLKRSPTKPAASAACKRARSGAVKHSPPVRCVTNDQLSTKYRRPHCPLCSQVGCLRNLEVICYCDPCQESRGEECSSPRMADFRRSHPGYVSKSAKTGYSV